MFLKTQTIKIIARIIENGFEKNYTPFNSEEKILFQNLARGGATVDGRNPKQPPGMVLKPWK